jgi:hypothetical protein
MSGLLRRIRGTRSPATEPAPDVGTAWDEAEHAPGEQPGGDRPFAAADGEQAPRLPAGVDLDRLVGDKPTSQRRGRLRRRLRHLRRVRELLLRDLGGLLFEIHRSGEQTDTAHALVDGKLARLASVDAELRELESILGDRRAMIVREPGIGGSCPLCGELHGSDARFCWACGTPVAPGAVRPVVSTGALPALGAGAAAVQSWTAPAAPAEPAPAAEPEPEAGTAVTEPVIEGSSEDA